MSNWVKDIEAMHTKFGVNKVVDELDQERLRWFLEFRTRFLQEELDELKKAMNDYDTGVVAGPQAADDVVDALIDLCVVAIGTLDTFRIKSNVSWNRVHRKNMDKETGVKESRPNPLGLPDLIKPEGWTPPNHKGNHGLLTKVFPKK